MWYASGKEDTLVRMVQLIDWYKRLIVQYRLGIGEQWVGKSNKTMCDHAIRKPSALWAHYKVNSIKKCVGIFHVSFAHILYNHHKWSNTQVNIDTVLLSELETFSDLTTFYMFLRCFKAYSSLNSIAWKRLIEWILMCYLRWVEIT